MSRIETKYLENRPHLVIPVTMATVGVLSGSNGPLFYPADELERSAARWNGIPIVVRHPDGGMSAMSPEVFSERKTGHVFNAGFDGHRLFAEAWLEIERLKIVDHNLFDRINRGDGPIEVSTGLFTFNEQTPGDFGGVPYDAVARLHVPDHLAILPDQVGACSVKAGCGLLTRNEELDMAIAF